MENELKQKQIEEMEKDIAIRMAGAKSVAGSMNNGVEGWIGKYLIERGWTKIPENAVVLTREDYNRLFTKARQSEIKTIDLESIVNTRKETAEKFAKRVKMAFYYEFDELIPSIMADKIDEIAKEIMEGEKEISNETV